MSSNRDKVLADLLDIGQAHMRRYEEIQHIRQVVASIEQSEFNARLWALFVEAIRVDTAFVPVKSIYRKA